MSFINNFFNNLTLNKYDIIFIILINFLTILFFFIINKVFFKTYKIKRIKNANNNANIGKLEYSISNYENDFYSLDSNNYLVINHNLDDKTRHIECKFNIVFNNTSLKDIVLNNIIILDSNYNEIESKKINLINDFVKLQNIKSYNKLTNIIINKNSIYECDINIKLNNSEYINNDFLYLAYKNNYNKTNYIKITINK